MDFFLRNIQLEIAWLRNGEKRFAKTPENKPIDRQGINVSNWYAAFHIQKNEIERGQVLAKPGSIQPHTKFLGQVYVLTEKEGGRSKPFFTGYRPQFYFRTTDVTGVINLPADVEMCRPGDNVNMDVELISPIACEKGLRFAIREGGRTVGSGVVAEINA